MTDTKKTVLITGSTRGIGLALVEHYTKAGWNVIATARATSNTDKVKALSPLKIVTLDTCDESSVLEAASELDEVPIDLLINNAGIAQPTIFATATTDSFMQQFEVNVTGPFLVTHALLPNLELAVKTRGDAVVLQVSSIVGSISHNNAENEAQVRGHYGYVASKAALNMVTRSLVLDLRDRNIIVVAANPGFVDTEMNSHQGHVKPADSAASMAKIVSNVSLKDSGKFFDADPTTSTSELPW
ncbi:short chain dehydrogenase [Phytophthora infestans]|uniref:Short chain dehydrogenase n=1 Tax=Phytophthora infestans TaxID=4787 RepID=A0A8S9UU93_PHYIN|nr:short chain dehydrogenase [Phytophthora infestans]KAF4147973.1 short chain dehydrogenase [Phytophthora infestans]